ncbi:MAG: LLM class flavin-dependent oxidoreductase [Chloroflexota bacterium]|nr:LLM class flavin-dependent oxidoreductase [Chloroflexota bacterium]
MNEMRRRELARPVGLGFAARGEVSEVVRWSEEARRQGLDSVWIHDSYFEREAVTYASAIAAQVPDIRVAMGALNPFTRHPVVLAMTVSALDEMAPGRVILGLGTGLPLRLAQMGIPYTPEAGVERVSQAMDSLRALWAGERLPTPGALPDLQPMFPPVHHVPIYIAAYRSAFMELAGQKADGYLARPAESIPALRRMIEKIRAASLAAGRPEKAVQVSGYLLTLVDSSRREALNRAKREPFVIYMLSVQSDVAMRRAGFDVELRDRVAAAWREEDFHRAANLMPDELVDAFILCGTREGVAERIWQYHEAGMDMPLVQPILPEDQQVQAVMEAAVEYGREAREATATAPAGLLEPAAAARPIDERLAWPELLRRRAGAWFEIVRPFSFTASTVPVAAAGAMAAIDGRFSWPLFLAALIAGLTLHIGTNVINEIYDVRKGIDTITSPRASHALLKGRLGEREAFAVAVAAFVVSTGIGIGLIAVRGWPVALFGALGFLGGWGYTAPPLQYKYRALGLPLVFLLMGPLMVVGGFYVVAGTIDPRVLVVSLPVGFLVTAILHGNEWRDISDDARAGIVTFSIVAGRRVAHVGYVSLVVGAYIALAMAVAAKVLPPLSLLPILSLPLLVRAIRASELGSTGQQRAIAMIDLQTAQLHAAFGFLLALGLGMAALVP